MLKILAICDSFKGTLSSSEVGKIVCEHYNKEMQNIFQYLMVVKVF